MALPPPRHKLRVDQRHVVLDERHESECCDRDFLLDSFPKTLSVPMRFAKRMMIVADLDKGNADAIEDAVIGAWEL